MAAIYYYYYRYYFLNPILFSQSVLYAIVCVICLLFCGAKRIGKCATAAGRHSEATSLIDIHLCVCKGRGGDEGTKKKSKRTSFLMVFCVCQRANES